MKDVLKFDKWTFKYAQARLEYENKEQLILEAKVSKLLFHFLTNPNKIITRDELLEHVWVGRIVSDYTINAKISELRKTLNVDKSSDKNRFIKTHPKIGYSFVVKVKNTDNENPCSATTIHNSNNSLAAYIITASLIAIIIVTLFSLFKSDEMVIVDKKFLSYKEGQIYSPSFSKDKELLAYIRLDEGEMDFQLVVKSGDGKDLFYESELNENIMSVGFSDVENEIYTLQYENGKCSVFQYEYSLNVSLSLNNKKYLTSCGSILTISPITIDNNWLYFSGAIKGNHNLHIQRFNLNTGLKESITNNSNSSHIDYYHQKLGDDLVVIRSVKGEKSQLLKVNLSSKEETPLLTLDFILFSASWLDDESLVFGEERQLKVYNLENKSVTPYLKLDGKVTYVHFFNSTSLIAIEGRYTKNNLYKGVLGDSKEKFSAVVSSAFLDKEAVLNQSDEIAFISNRTGREQIYLNQGDNLKQLTDFEGNVKLQELTFSNAGNKLLFIKNDTLYNFNIEIGVVEEVIGVTGRVVSAVYKCDDETILYTTLNDDSIDLYSLKFKNSFSKLVNNEVDYIHADCESDIYAGYSGKQKIFKVFNEELSIETKIPYEGRAEFEHSKSFAIQNGQIIYSTVDNIQGINIVTSASTSVNFPFSGIWEFSILNNTIVFGKKNTKSSHLVQYTIKKQ